MKKAAIAFFVLSVSFIVQAAGHHAYADPSCQVAVKFSPKASTAEEGSRVVPRQNPDGTYYPGDAFDFTVLVSWTRNCWQVYPQQITPSGLELSGLSRGPTYYDDQQDGHFYESGHAEIGTGSFSASVSQVVRAFGLVCDIYKCSKGYTSAKGSYAPVITRPEATVGIWFENFTDRDGYKMRNSDGTYYVWDGINLVYLPDYKWKAAREGTIDARTGVESDLPAIGRFECHMDLCPYTFRDAAITPWSYHFSYEEGHAAYNSTSRGYTGPHIFSFHTVIYNMGRRIGDGTNSTSALVVQYRPVFASYPYLVLKDTSSWWGFGKTPAVALHYYGSEGGGRGDGAGTVHGERRSKINGFAYKSFAYRVLAPVPLNESLTWAGAYQAEFSDGNLTYHDDSLQPGSGSAMFVHSGYGKLVFYHPILHTILETRYDNSSITNTLQSSDFAGYGTYNLTRYHFSYPQTRFSTDVLAMALHGNGTTNPVHIAIQMTPDRSQNATYEQDFVRMKVAHDSDRIIAGMVLGDMYGRTDSASGTGIANMRANLTSMAMPYVYRVFAHDPLDLPLNLVYEQPSPYNVTITAGNRSLSFAERAFEFDTSWRYIVNTDRDNSLNGTAYHGLVTIFPDANFGPYSRILVDGSVLDTPCAQGCTVLLPGRGNFTVEAFNAWGGMAAKNFTSEPAVALPFHYNLLLPAVVLLTGMTVFAAIKKYGGAIAGALGLFPG